MIQLIKFKSINLHFYSISSKTNKIRMLYDGEAQSNFTITSPGWYPDFYLIIYRVGGTWSTMIIGDGATYNISYTDSTTTYNTTNYQVYISITRNKNTNTDQYVVRFSDWLGSRPSGTFTGKFHYLAKVYGIRC